MIGSLLIMGTRPALLVLALAAFGVWPTWHWTGETGLVALVAAAGICFLAALVSAIPLSLALLRQAQWLALACLAGTVVRLLLTILAAAVVFVVIKPHRLAFGLWIVVFYLALMIWETRNSLKHIRAFYPETGPKNDTDLNSIHRTV